MRSLLVISFLLASATSWGQFHNAKSKSELGFLIGGSYYHGDLNPYQPFYKTNLAGGLVYRYNIHSRLSYRANLTYGKLEASDADSKVELYQERNLSFTNTIWELGTGVEFNYFPFQLGHDRYKGTAYILAEIAVFRMNPKGVMDDGNEVELQPLGTEGQGSSLSSNARYKLTQIAIPLGVGAKVSLGSVASLNLEFGIRKTFTDYIDDVSSGSYVDPVALAAENGPTAAAMSNRSLSGSRFGKRGNSSAKDWYVFSGLMITFRLGSPSKCYSH
jgi:hypothetical protein